MSRGYKKHGVALFEGTMIRDFNLLATSETLTQSAASSELWMLLRAAGDEAPAVDRSPARGLVTARTSFDPVQAVAKLRERLRENPDHFKSLLRVIPVQRRVATEVGEIAGTAAAMATEIGDDESFRVTLEKRRTHLRSRTIIDAVAEGIDRKVDLESPDWVVLVEIVGRVTGLSLIKPDGILNVQKERYRLLAERQ